MWKFMKCVNHSYQMYGQQLFSPLVVSDWCKTVKYVIHNNKSISVIHKDEVCVHQQWGVWSKVCEP